MRRFVFERASMRIAVFGVLALLLAPALAAEENAPVDFARHVVPMLYKLGCSNGSCHGSFAGRGGFRLSLFASDPAIDYANLRGGLARRLDPLQPDASLLLRKPSVNGVPHGGGRRFAVDSREYQLLKEWITSGAVYDPAASDAVVGVRVEPPLLTIRPGDAAHSVKVIAELASGKKEDVTWYTTFESRDPSIAEIDSQGQVHVHRVGDVAVLAHYAGWVAFTIVEAPAATLADAAFPAFDLADPVDRLVVEKLRRLNIVPSPSCSDEEFIRRAYLDVASVLPTSAEVQAFQADTSPDKRAQLIDRLLEHPLHHALWATRFTDMLGADNRFVNAVPYHDWFRNKLEQNTPWDKIAYGVFCGSAADERSIEQIKESIAAATEERRRKAALKKNEPSEYDEPPSPPDPNAPHPWQIGYGARTTLDQMYSGIKFQQTIRGKNNEVVQRILDSKQVALQLSHAFLGVQLTCAQCHKHPYDKWTQNDFFGFAASFTYVKRGVDPRLKEQEKVSLNGIYVDTEPAETFADPVTGEPIAPCTLGGTAIAIEPGKDPRRANWEWMVQPENPYFAKSIVNRIWAHYMGRGLYEPVDSQSAANPPSHPQVLKALAADFAASGYDLKQLHKRILRLAAYQRSWKTNSTNATDGKNYSHRLLRRLTAEQVVDAISQITGAPPALTKVYSGEIRDGAKVIEMASSRFRGDDWHTLTIFGKPRRAQACDCERSSDPSLAQAMYLYNDESLWTKLRDPQGRLHQLTQSETNDDELLTELYLSTLSRPPNDTERATSKKYLAESANRFAGYVDILWSLLNRQEFLVSH